MEAVRSATARCPFLRNVVETSGHGFAEHVAVQPEQPYAGVETSGLSRCPFAGLTATFRRFHDSEAGIVPLQPQRVTAVESRILLDSCLEKPASRRTDGSATVPEALRSQSAGCPFAAISLGGLPGPEHFLRKWLRQRRADQKAKQQQRSNANGSHGPSSEGPANSRSGPIRGHGTNTGGSPICTSGRPPGISAPPRNKQQRRHAQNRKPPYWKKYGPMGRLAPFGPNGELACPPLIVAARAFVAGLPPVQELRPQALHIKMASIALVAAAANVPFGAFREHVKKFSFSWFLVVHATIPFIALLRKGVVMPRWAIVLTITGAIVGQTIGSRLERQRLTAHSSKEAHSSSSSSFLPLPVASLAAVPGDLVDEHASSNQQAEFNSIHPSFCGALGSDSWRGTGPAGPAACAF